MYLRTAIFWVTTTCRDNIFVPFSEVKKDGTDGLSRNVVNKLTLLAA